MARPMPLELPVMRAILPARGAGDVDIVMVWFGCLIFFWLVFVILGEGFEKCWKAVGLGRICWFRR